MDDSGEEDIMNYSEKVFIFSKKKDQCSEIMNTAAVNGPPSDMYEPPILPPLTGIRELQGNAIERRSNEFNDDSAFSEISLKEYESHLRGEFSLMHDTGFWDTNNLNDRVSLTIDNGINHEDKVVADDGIKDLGNSFKSGGSFTVDNGMENVENEVTCRDDSALTYEASHATDNILEDCANTFESENEADNREEDNTGVNEANLAIDNNEEGQSSDVIESGMEDEAQRTAISLRSSMVIGDTYYLDGSSTDLEIVDDLGLFRRPYSYIIENFKKDPKEITVDRGSVYATLLQFYKENRSIHQTEVKFVDEPGVGLGPIKEALRLFHAEGKDWLYEGDGEMIPRTCGDQSKALGRALSDMFLFNGGFPPFLSKPFIFKLLSERDIDEESFLKSYVNFLSISIDDKSNLLSAVNDRLLSKTKTKLFEVITREKEIKIVQNIGPNYFNDSVNETNWRQFMIDLARLELIEKPACVEVADEFKLCVTMEGYELGSAEEAKEIIENMNPTPQSIIDMIETEDSPITLTQDMKEAYGFLKRFITSECVEDNIAELFLMFCTSSTNRPLEKILIDFNSANGLARAVTVNTCANLLHLPTTYKSYAEFKEEFMNTQVPNLPHLLLCKYLVISLSC